MEKYQQLIDKLADKTLSFGCMIKTKKGNSDLDKYECIFIQECEDENGKWINFMTYEENNIIGRYSWVEKDSRGCGWGNIKILGHPILIGDILEKMKEQGGGIHKIMGYMELVKLWQDCGFTKSLQNINDRESNNLIKQLSPQATELLDFIISLNLK